MIQPISPEVLAHYGVLGMKWGVRKDGKPQGYQGPGDAGGSSKKQRRIEKKQARKSARAERKTNSSRNGVS